MIRTAAAGTDPGPGILPERRPIFLVTGGTSGIGRASAEDLARQGATLVIVGREPDRTKLAAAQIGSGAGRGGVMGIAADLSRVGEVRRLAAEVSDRFPRLDGLVNDAGAIYSTRQLTAEGHERTWALNVLAPFLLTKLLADRLAASGSGRVVNLSSSAHRWAHLDLADPERTRAYSAFGAYGRSKLALLMLSYEWARRLRPMGICVNAVSPGFVSSRFGRENPGAFGVGLAFLETLFGSSPARGARTVTYLASSPEVAGVTGGYFARCHPVRSSRVSYDEERARLLWDLCDAQTRDRS